MIIINSPSGEIYLKPEVEILDEFTGVEIINIIMENIKPSGKIILDLCRIKTMDSNGFYLLRKIKKEAKEKNCEIYFTNAVQSIEELIDTITTTDES